MSLGSYVEHDGRPAVRFVRDYPHPITDVWAAVSDGPRLSQWFPATVTLEPRVGGRVTFSGDPHTEGTVGVVLILDPPRRLAFTWSEDELHFELDATDEGHCRLTMTNVLADRDAAARNAAGWTVCLAELAKLIAGRPVDGPHSSAADPWQPLYDAYRERGMPSGAEIPSASG